MVEEAEVAALPLPALMSNEALMPYLDVAIRAAFAASKAILGVYDGPFEVAHKADRSPVTRADHEAHRAIEEVLAERQLPLLSEEGTHARAIERRDWAEYWLVDPLDGTKDFIQRNGEFTVNISLMRSDRQGEWGTSAPVLGVIHAPVSDVLYFAWQGGGAWRQSDAATHPMLPTYERVALSERLPLTEPGTTYTVLSSRSHHDPRTASFLDELRREHGTLAHRTVGSALKFGLMAEGRAHVYPRFAPTMEWDTAAGQLICSEAGRTLIDTTTQAPMRYNKAELVNNWFIVQ